MTLLTMLSSVENDDKYIYFCYEASKKLADESLKEGYVTCSLVDIGNNYFLLFLSTTLSVQDARCKML